MANNEDYDIYLGVWTNWSRGKVMGATLTLSRWNANLVIAFTSFFVGLVGTRCWRIICILAHHFLSTSDPERQDGLHQQRQLVLRNSPSSDAAVISLASLAWAWRGGRAERLSSRLMPLLFAAGFTAVGFVVAGGYSAAISTGVGSEVLLRGDKWTAVARSEGSGYGPEAFGILSPYMADYVSNAQNYMQQCYSPGNSTTRFHCNLFVVPSLPSTFDLNAGCPFSGESGLCRRSSGNLLMDSGYIDSHMHLGINAAPEHRFLFRTTEHCAPLNPEGREGQLTAEDGTSFTTYNFGGKIHDKTTGVVYNYTEAVPSIGKQYPQEAARVAGATLAADYRLITAKAKDDFVLDPAFGSVSGDLYLLFLVGNGVTFTEKTPDPWYAATTNYTTAWQSRESEGFTVYRADNAASALGCVHRFQYCRSGPGYEPPGEHSESCGPMSSLEKAIFGAMPLFDAPADAATSHSNETWSETAQAFYLFVAVMTMVGFEPPGYLASIMGPKVLASQRLLRTGVQGGFPDSMRQWQVDMMHIWNTSLATLQSAFVTDAHGVTSDSLEPYTSGATLTGEKRIAQNQKILSTNVGSFSLFGLLFTFLLGLVVVVLSFWMESVLAVVHRAWPDRTKEKVARFEYARLEWATNETLQQHRMAQEGCGWGRGTWTGRTAQVPLLGREERLGALHVEDAENPVLRMREGVKRQESWNGSDGHEERREKAAPVIHVQIEETEDVWDPFLVREEGHAHVRQESHEYGLLLVGEEDTCAHGDQEGYGHGRRKT